MQEIGTEVENGQSFGIDSADLDASLAEAKVRFAKTDLSATPPIAPAVSEQAREIQHLKAQLVDAERMAMRAQKAAYDYREQLTEAQADIANMKSRWYAAEKARNAVSSQRDVDSSSLNTQVLRLQKELERAQQMASSDMERAAVRIRTLEERLEQALRNVAVAESSQLQYRQRSNLSLVLGVSLASIFAGILIYQHLPHPAQGAEISTTSSPSGSGGSRGIPRRVQPAIPLEALSQKPFVPRPPVKSLPDALGRMDRAMKALPGLDPEDVIRQVRKRQSTPERPVCQFDWSNGGPSMVFERTAKGQSMENWAVAISRCADAVEQAH
jgi:hypothetical protein